MQETTKSSGGEYSVRRCTPEDIPSVINVNSLTLPEHYSDYFYYEILKDFPNTFLVAEMDGKVAGYIMCRMEYGLSMTKRFGLAKKGHIISVAVLEEYRNKGIGTKLMKDGLEEVRKESGKECYLEVRITNVGAIELYKVLGFKVTNTLHGYYKDGESAYTMAMSL
ncbi:MAG: GNAT family N-acetyltransferase [Thaumarchaeota archaeon]|nr:GNAT family N-acetyltransferase [Nitrososphaerota archaeon]